MGRTYAVGFWVMTTLGGFDDRSEGKATVVCDCGGAVVCEQCGGRGDSGFHFQHLMSSYRYIHRQHHVTRHTPAAAGQLHGGDDEGAELIHIENRHHLEGGEFAGAAETSSDGSKTNANTIEEPSSIVMTINVKDMVYGPDAISAALLIQRWYRQHVARLEMRRRCTWNIFQSIEYAGEQDQIKLYNFFGFLMDHFTPASSESKTDLNSSLMQRNLISHIFRKNEICRDTEWERYFCYKSIEVTKIYIGPHLTFPMTFCEVSKLVEAFKHKEQLHARYVLQLLGETWRLLRTFPNISHVIACHTKQITICGTQQQAFTVHIVLRYFLPHYFLNALEHAVTL
ncbi:hypothetical protein F7725_015670 [Dissostichus mawsoni]|uniref:protein-serine/threonine phosphatase n=1 Tax=Dissostichus mawsoni TaxID=36200 RepID=A0A7J5YJ23_DISMA|nr:hypothetical protein F7725_015670 [Dissostichus mawsoni]